MLKQFVLLSTVLFFLFNAALAEQQEYRIKSESSQIDLAKQTVIYLGNASFFGDNLLIEGDKIEAFTVDDKLSTIRVTGNPAKLKQSNITSNTPNNLLADSSAQTEIQSLELIANTIIYETASNHLIAQDNVKLEINALDKSSDTPSDAFFKAQGNQLNLSTLSYAQIKLTGTPMSLSIDQENISLEATAQAMQYSMQTELLELSKDVNLSTGSERIKAQKILYNGKTQFLEIPKIPNQTVEMIQNKKQSNE